MSRIKISGDRITQNEFHKTTKVIQRSELMPTMCGLNFYFYVKTLTRYVEMRPTLRGCLPQEIFMCSAGM